MAYRSALVDKGQILRKAGTGKKVNGYTVTGVVEGELFKARLQLSSNSETTRDDKTSADVRPILNTDKKDKLGNLLAFRISDRIRVISRELGTDVWEVDGEPEPIRKKRRIIGWILQVHRVEEPQAD